MKLPHNWNKINVFISAVIHDPCLLFRLCFMCNDFHIPLWNIQALSFQSDESTLHKYKRILKKIRTLQKAKHTFGSLVTQEGRREKSALTGIFYFLLAADEEHQQNVAAAAAGARPRPHGEERAEGMPRRRRNMGNRLMAQRRAQQAEEWLEGNTGFSWFCRHWNKPSQQVLELGKGCSCLLEEVVEFCWGVIWP